jgi:SAM-dependent methyltransferase
VASALVIHFIPDRQKAFAEMKRVLAPGGLVGGYTWEAQGMTEFAAYAPMIDGIAAIGIPPPHSEPVGESSIDGMRASLRAAGYADVAAIEIEVTQSFKNFDEYWEIQTLPFARAGKAVQALDETKRARLARPPAREAPAADGTITYSATAMAGKARKP